jgi:hypothetical protein
VQHAFLRDDLVPGRPVVATREAERHARRADAHVADGDLGQPRREMRVDELFWGYDDFPYLELFLAGKDPIDPAEWAKRDRPVPASSVRRRFR